MKQIEEVIYAPVVKNFVVAHPYLVWCLLTLVLTALIVVPVLWMWPKKVK